MGIEVPQPNDETLRVNEYGEKTIFPNIAVYGHGMRFINVVFAVLFAAVLATVVVTGNVDRFFIYVLILIAVGNLWTSVKLFVQRPRMMIEDNMFSLRLLPTWTSQASNIAEVEMRAGKVIISFHDLEAVQATHSESALSKSFDRRGYHIDTPRGVFSLEQVNELRAALGMPHQEHDRFAEFETRLHQLTPHVIVTPVLIAVNVIIFLAMALTAGEVLGANIPLMIEWGANYAPLTTTGQWWRLLTSMFLHFGVIHLLFNMWILRNIGQIVERLVGNTGFAVGYLISGFFGSVVSVFWHNSGVSAGASGAVFGVFGMLLGFVALHKQSVPKEVVGDHRGYAMTFVIYNVVIGFSISWIDLAAHLGGFVAGFVCGLVLGCDLNDAPIKRRIRNLALALSGTALAVLAVDALPVSPPDLRMIGQKIDDVDAAKVKLYRNSYRRFESGELSQEQVARKIRTFIVPAYVDLADSLKNIRPQNQQQEQLKSAFMKYVQLRREGWELLADAVEIKDFDRERRATQKFKTAITVMKQFGATTDEAKD